MLSDLYVSSLRGELDQMSADAGIVIAFSVFVPFEDTEIQEFFTLCSRFDAAAREFSRAQALRPCPQVLTWEERGRDSRALELIQDKASLSMDRVRHAVREFRKSVFERFKASRN